MIEVELPDGTILEIDTDDPDQATTAARNFMSRQGADVQQSSLPDPAPAAPSAPPVQFDNSVQRGLNVGLQGVGQGAAGLLGFPGFIEQSLRESFDALAGTNLRENNFFPTQEEISGGFVRNVVEPLGGNLLPEEQMAPGERLARSGTALGAEALAGSGGLIRAAGDDLARRALGPLIADEVAESAAKGTAGRILAGDTAGGVGAGTAIQAAQETGVPDVVGEAFGPAGETAANLAAALTGAVAGNTAARSGSFVRGTDNQPIPQSAVDPQTGDPFGQAIIDSAAFLAQQAASNPATARAKMLDRIDELRTDENIASAAGRPRDDQLPTVGALAQDTGLAASEKTARTIDEVPFRQRDRETADFQRKVVESVAEPGDGRAFTDEFERRATQRRAGAQEEVQATQAAEEAALADQRATGEAISREGSAGPAAATQIDDVVTSELRQRQDRKNRAAEAIDPEGTVERDAGFLQEAADDIEGSQGRLNDPAQNVPQGVINRIRALGDEDGPGTVTVREMNELRPELSSAIEQARKDGNFTMADNLRSLRNAINDDLANLAGEGSEAGFRAAEFQRVFREEFAPLFARGPGDEAAKFRKDFNLDRDARTTTPPSETAGRFLRPASPEKAQSLSRILEASPRGGEGRAAARNFLLADLVQAGVVDQKSGTVNRVQLGKWRRRWGDETLNSAAPGLTDELDSISSRAGRDEAKATELARASKAAVENQKLTEAEIKKGALGFALDRDPVSAIQNAFSSKDPERAFKSIVEEIGDDSKAREGLKQATREWLLDTKTNAENGIASDRPLSFAKMSELFEKRAGALAEIFEPDEMNKLRQVHRLLKDEQIVKSAKAVQGSDTSPRQESAKKLERALEATLKLKFGVLKGGGIMRALKIGAESLPGNDFNDRLRRAIVQMHLDPELAAHLLARNVEGKGPIWNRRLQTLLGVKESVDQTDDSDADQ